MSARFASEQSLKRQYATYLRLAVKQYIELPGNTYCSSPAAFKAPGFDEVYGPDHIYRLFPTRQYEADPNAHLFRDQERRLSVERQARDEERRNDTVKIVNRSLTNLAVMTGDLVPVPEV